MKKFSEMTPGDQVKEVLLRASEIGSRLFRRNVGMAWVGDEVIRRKDGSVTLTNARPFVSGVKGMSDTDGWRTVTITPDMVGQRIAQFVAIEVKSGTGRLSPEQESYLGVVKKAGGCAGVVRSLEDVDRVLRR